MPISDDEVRKPKWIKYEEGATLSRDDTKKYMDFTLFPRSYRGGVFPQAGYNANNPSIAVERLNLNKDELRPRAN